MLENIYSGKRVWISGDTGFKGAWLASWLADLGATVHGFSLEPPTEPSLFSQLGMADRIHHQHGDVRDGGMVRRSIEAAEPDFVFHLAAQAIVRTSFEFPVETYETNVMGTIHVLEALRSVRRPCSAVLVTSDKCYQNREWIHGYREEDPLGGFDPYSSSKAAAEIAIASWRQSFFGVHPVRVASVRSGNVIGGGDWAKDRIVPDCIRALRQGSPIPIRNWTATRPWQHVLEPLSGYLWLGAVLSRESLRPYARDLFASAFNLGPALDSNVNVGRLVQEITKHWPGHWEDRSDPGAVHEAKLLQLAADKAFHLLGWRPVWGFEKTIEATVKWYRSAAEMENGPASAARMTALTAAQIAEYQRDAARGGLPWAAAADLHDEAAG